MEEDGGGTSILCDFPRRRKNVLRAAPSPNFDARLVDAIGVHQLGAWPRRAHESDDRERLARYAWNTAVAASLWPALHAAEVILRQRLLDAVEVLHQPSPDAYARVPHWLDASPSLLHPIEHTAIDMAVSDLRRSGAALDAGSLVCTLPFRFWTRLLGTHYETARPGRLRIWPHGARLVAPHAPSRFRTRAVLAHRFAMIRALRNAVAHHDPICTDSALGRKHAELLETVSWLSAEAGRFLREVDSFRVEYRKGSSRFVHVIDRLALAG